VERKNIMNETMKLLFNALMDEETFATPDIESEWSNILKLSGVAKDFKIENAISESIGRLWNSTSENAFQIGFRTAVNLLMSK